MISQDEYYTVYDYMNEGMYTVDYRNYSVGCPDSEIVIQIAGVSWYEQEPPEETPTPTAVATWFVPPSPTPRVTRSVETPVGSSSIDTIMQQGTLVSWRVAWSADLLTNPSLGLYSCLPFSRLCFPLPTSRQATAMHPPDGPPERRCFPERRSSFSHKAYFRIREIYATAFTRLLLQAWSNRRRGSTWPEELTRAARILNC